MTGLPAIVRFPNRTFERLAHMPSGARLVLLGEKADVVSDREQTFEEHSRPSRSSRER